MASLFDAVNLAKRSLMSMQWAMTTSSHNVSNVNTPGYTRQRAELESFKPPLEVPGGLIGMGVEVGEITRLRNRYLDRQVLAERQNQGFLNFENTALAQVETILGETSGYGISGILDEFWASWSDLANEPENTSVRTVVQQKGDQLAKTLNDLHNDLVNQQKELDLQLTGFVGQINQIAAQVASLNQSISEQVAMGVQPNDLMDQRDLLLDQLSNYANIEMQDESNGSVSVWLGGQILVYRDTSQSLALNDMPNTEGKLHSVVWASNSGEVNFQSGQVAGLLLVRDETIPELQNGLDEFTVALVTEINAIHNTGYALDGSTNLDFFDSSVTGAADIKLALEVSQDADKIAASADGSIGNGDIALALFDLQNELVMNNGTSTLGGFYATLAADVGSLKQIAETELYESEIALQQLDSWKTSAEGVSLDEEMANLVQFQHTYTAIARYMSAIDEMLGQLLAIVG